MSAQSDGRTRAVRLRQVDAQPGELRLSTVVQRSLGNGAVRARWVVERLDAAPVCVRGRGSAKNVNSARSSVGAATASYVSPRVDAPQAGDATTVASTANQRVRARERSNQSE